MYNPHFDEKTFRASVQSFNLPVRTTDLLMFRVRNLIVSEEQPFAPGFSDFRKTVTTLAHESGRDVKEVVEEIIEDPSPLFKAHKMATSKAESAYDQDRAVAALSPYLQMQRNRTKRAEGPRTISQATRDMLARPTIERMSEEQKRKLRTVEDKQDAEEPQKPKKKISVKPRIVTSAPAKQVIDKAPAPPAVTAPVPEVVQKEETPAVPEAVTIIQPVDIVINTPSPKKKIKPAKPAAKKETKKETVSNNGLVACDLFRNSATFIRKNRTLPDPKSYHHYLGGISVADINKAFAKGNVTGLSDLLPGKDVPKHVFDFFVATGLAERKGRELIPASPKKLDELVKALG